MNIFHELFSCGECEIELIEKFEKTTNEMWTVELLVRAHGCLVLIHSGEAKEAD